MKKIIAIFVILAVLIQLNVALAEMSHEHLCEEFPTGMAFGQHVSEHARQGHFNREMNPGMHQGFSVCVR